MAKTSAKKLSSEVSCALLDKLQTRFKKHGHRHPGIQWKDVEARLQKSPSALWSIQEMERTGGEPDLVLLKESDLFAFYDCSVESPTGRRSLCYDREGWKSRKDFRPEDNAIDVATAMGIEMLTEAQYLALQEIGPFDLKTSSWIKTPAPMRKLGGALFGDYRYGRVFIAHNGAQSYYAARGFRGVIKVEAL